MITTILSVVGAILVAAISAGLVSRRVDRKLKGANLRKASVEAESVEVGYLREELNAMRQDVANLRSELAAVESIMIEYRSGVRILVGQIEELGHTPRWRPPDDPK